jgi:tetratricopeptide (TPR) repeat protein
MAEAEEMYIRALRGYDKAWGLEHTSSLDTINNLGMLYATQGKMAEAEEMYARALRGYEKALGVEHTSTLRMVNNLGLLYKKTEQHLSLPPTACLELEHSLLDISDELSLSSSFGEEKDLVADVEREREIWLQNLGMAYPESARSGLETRAEDTLRARA